jgi:DMSO/TMAO reductase YedYZ molybdopterin-dependent catalytic subunit
MFSKRFIIAVVVLSVVGLFHARGTQALGKRGEGNSETTESVEIREHEGRKLSSMNDFRENSIKGPQHIDKEEYTLRIKGLVENPRTYSYHDVVSEHEHHKKVVTLNCVEGWSVTILWEGIKVRDLLEGAQPLSEAKVVIFHAHDGYSTSFPVDYIMENDIIMAHKMNGIVLPPERGFPFELVANYKGLWERRGYSNDGDLDRGFFEE